MLRGARSKSSVLTSLLLSALLIACGGSGSAEATEAASGQAAPEAGHALRIGFGQPVDLSEHLVRGEITVFDFMSDFCPPCRQIAPWMERLNNERPGVSVVKVDINRPEVKGRIDWQSPLAAQFKLQSIPHFKIYDAEGKLMAEGDRARDILFAWLGELSDPDEESSDQS